MHPAARCKLAGNFYLPGAARCDEIVEDAVDHILVEYARVAIALQVELEALEFYAEFACDVFDFNHAEVGLARLGANGGKLRRDVGDYVISFGVRVLECFNVSHVLVSVIFEVLLGYTDCIETPRAVGLFNMTESKEKLAVVLLSGGLDSATTLAMAADQGFICHAISFDYGQRHRFELDSAAVVASTAGVKSHRIICLDLSASGGFGTSALTDEIDVPKDAADATGIPITYVPARNTIFLSIALGYAEVIGAFDIFIGVNAIDYSGYPDCRPEFIESFEATANLATAASIEGKGRFKIHAPLIEMTKSQIIQTGLILGVDYSLTHSCYDPDSAGGACGRCDSCRLRLAGFADAGRADPIRYQS